MKVNNKGQALVEFVIVMPIFIIILLVVVDFGNIIHQKYVLENDIDTISEMYQSDKREDIDTYLDKIDATVNYDYDQDYVTIVLEKNVDIGTGFLGGILGKNYKITASKTILSGDDSE